MCECPTTRSSALRFCIWAPAQFTYRSAGIRALWVLRDELRARGQMAETRLIGWTRPHADDIIHIVPEGEQTPPESKVVRWLLGRSRPFPTHSGCFDVTWHIEFYPDAQYLRVDLIDPTVFYSFGPDVYRAGELVYFGKDPSMPRPAVTGTEIMRDWPPTQPELADLLRRAAVLHCYDSLTLLVLEAVLCGCPVMLMHPGETPRSWRDIPGLFVSSDQLMAAREATAKAPAWYEVERRRNSASVDAFIARCRTHWQT